jgi:N-acetyl sugar amidotransferase
MGVCNYCHKFKAIWSRHDYEKKEKELKKIFEKYRGKSKYDCIVPLSGGKDSTYVLYLCKVKYDLKVLAVNFDNGFQSEQAKSNMKKAVEKLDVDFIQYRPKFSLMKKLMRIFLLKTGEFCTPCNSGIRATNFGIAEKYKVKLLVSGQSVKETFPKEIYSISQAYFRDVIKDEIPLWEVKDYLWPDYKWLFYRQIYLPYYIEWNVFEITKILRKELGWEEAPHGTEHTDCILAPLIDYLRIRKWGFGIRTHKYALYVREGWITREEALEKVTKEESDKEPEVMNYFLKESNLTRHDIEESFKMSHMNFKSQNMLLLNLFRKITGSRFILKEWEL